MAFAVIISNFCRPGKDFPFFAGSESFIISGSKKLNIFDGGKNMSVLKRICLFLFCMCLVTGCYEDTVELTLNSDGSGTIKQKLVFSERFMVAAEENKGSQNIPFSDKQDLVRRIGSAIEITSFKQTSLPDGGRVIEIEGAFRRPEHFFLSDYCREQIKLRIAPAGKGKVAVYCDMKQSDGGGPNLTQIYGLAKGLYIKRTVHLPGEIEKTNGDFDKAANTVSWTMDLRNKQGLDQTKAFIEGPDKGDGFAVFNASGLKFPLPLKVTALPKKATAIRDGESPKASAGLAAKVIWVSVNKKMLAEGAGIAEMSDPEIGIELSWNEGHCPVRCEKPVLMNLLDDLNKDLVSDKGPRVHQGQIFTSEKKNRKKELTLRAITPSSNAKKLRQLEGYVEVITGVVKETVDLENVQELAGKESTGNPVLDKLNFRIRSITGSTLKVEIDGGHKRITSLVLIKEDGGKVEKSGGMGGGDEYSYDFREDISKVTRCELEVVVSQNTVKVPFSLEEISLP